MQEISINAGEYALDNHPGNVVVQMKIVKVLAVDHHHVPLRFSDIIPQTEAVVEVKVLIVEEGRTDLRDTLWLGISQAQELGISIPAEQ